MAKSYEILKLTDDEYNYLVIMCNTISPYNVVNDLIKTVENSKGKIIVDQFLHVGNTDKRFWMIEYENGKVTISDFVNIKKDSDYRRKSCEFLRENVELENSILTTVQKRMIKKGIVI